MTDQQRTRLTAENTNASGHTLFFDCPNDECEGTPPVGGVVSRGRCHCCGHPIAIELVDLGDGG